MPLEAGGEKSGAPSWDRRRLTRAATPSSVVRLRRLRDIVGLPRLLRLPPTLRRVLIVGPRGLKNGVVEVKNRKTGERDEMSLDAALSRIAG